MTAFAARLAQTVARYKQDPESVYNTWFIGSEARLKAFRSLRRGVAAVVDDIQAGRFPNDFKGSSLEFVLGCITEQKQVFEGAAHPFYWKPKLRIPDIYENAAHKQAFGQFLFRCLHTADVSALEREIARLDALAIKGLGPAVANILYFLHPTVFPPFNTAMVQGFNRLFGAKLKLGSCGPRICRCARPSCRRMRKWRRYRATSAHSPGSYSTSAAANWLPPTTSR